MIILPAIDIKDGQCVRLTKGDFSTVEKVAEDPLTTALDFQAQGAEWIHMVDLDGAKEGSLKNSEIFVAIAKETNLKVELGGGIRTLESIEYYLNNGISRVILGSVALNDQELVREAAARYGERIAVGIDARDGMVSASGWLKDSDLHYIDLARAMEAIGINCIIFTDISRDGTLTGPNLEQLAELNDAVDCNIIASGGIHTIRDIEDLRQMGLYGAICGKSIYQGTLSLKEAIDFCRKE